MDKSVMRYYQLKQKQKEIEREVADLRQEILHHCAEQGVRELEIGKFRVKIIAQDRREYDDQKLYEALPDPDIWRLVSRADPAKIDGLVKLNVISEDLLRPTYTMKQVSSLVVEKL